jgi:hypothetical protein
MTKKILMLALTPKFGDSAAQLVAMIGNTANPSVEAEMLLGVWEAPILEPTVKSRGETRTLLNANWCDAPHSVVKYTTSGIRICFFESQTEAAKTHISRYAGRDSKQGNYQFEGISNWTETNNCSIEQWLEWSNSK